jgi:lysophospholipid acyltransferase (LPLAT)-like uncharacterized protein
VRLDRSSRRYRLWVRFVSLAGALLIRTLGRTWRITTEGPDPFAPDAPRRPIVGAVWHQGLLIAAFNWRGKGLAVPVSQSRDGDLIAGVLAALGFAETPRGSSSRGGTSLLRSLLRLTRAGTIVAVLPDGPRGPARRVKPGVVVLASATGADVIPVGLAAHPAHRFRSWDRALLPLPFARVHCVYGTPYRLPKDVEDPQAFAAQLEAALDDVTLAAERTLTSGPGQTAGDPA